MKLDIDFSELEILVKNMGANTVIWESNVSVTKLNNDWKVILETTGLDVDINDIAIAANGLLQYRDEQILLYIKEISGFGHNVSLPKFHFYQCQTLNNMQNKGRFERYVVTQRKTGYFLMDKKIGYNDYQKDVEEKLNVCKNCLSWYNRNYRKWHSVESFDIYEFFENFSHSPIDRKPTYTDVNAPISGYSTNWDSISLALKKECRYICQQCQIDLSKNPQLLHTHHINGVKSDNRQSNLKVLCIECHAEQPSHGHINNRFSEQIRQIRKIKQSGY